MINQALLVISLLFLISNTQSQVIYNNVFDPLYIDLSVNDYFQINYAPFEDVAIIDLTPENQTAKLESDQLACAFQQRFMWENSICSQILDQSQLLGTVQNNLQTYYSFDAEVFIGYDYKNWYFVTPELDRVTQIEIQAIQADGGLQLVANNYTQVYIQTNETKSQFYGKSQVFFSVDNPSDTIIVATHDFSFLFSTNGLLNSYVVNQVHVARDQLNDALMFNGNTFFFAVGTDGIDSYSISSGSWAFKHLFIDGLQNTVQLIKVSDNSFLALDYGQGLFLITLNNYDYSFENATLIYLDIHSFTFAFFNTTLLLAANYTDISESTIQELALVSQQNFQSLQKVRYFTLFFETKQIFIGDQTYAIVLGQSASALVYLQIYDGFYAEQADNNILPTHISLVEYLDMKNVEQIFPIPLSHIPVEHQSQQNDQTNFVFVNSSQYYLLKQEASIVIMEFMGNSAAIQCTYSGSVDSSSEQNYLVEIFTKVCDKKDNASDSNKLSACWIRHDLNIDFSYSSPQSSNHVLAIVLGISLSVGVILIALFVFYRHRQKKRILQLEQNVQKTKKKYEQLHEAI